LERRSLKKSGLQREALTFSGFFFPIAWIGEFVAMIILHFRLFLSCQTSNTIFACG